MNMSSRIQGEFGLPSAIDEQVGRRMRKLRLANGQTRLQLAQYLDVMEDSIHQMEAGNQRIGPTILFDLTRCFGVRVSYFFVDA